jgi:hypothetical protein
MKTIFATLSIVFVLGTFAMPILSHAQIAPYFGVDPPILSCSGNYQGESIIKGSDGKVKYCTSICDLMATLENVIKFATSLAIYIVAPIMIMYGGVLLLFSGGSSGQLKEGKKVMTGTVIAIILVICSNLLISTILWLLGNATSPTVDEFGNKVSVDWPNIACDVTQLPGYDPNRPNIIDPDIFKPDDPVPPGPICNAVKDGKIVSVGCCSKNDCSDIAACASGKGSKGLSKDCPVVNDNGTIGGYGCDVTINGAPARFCGSKSDCSDIFDTTGKARCGAGTCKSIMACVPNAPTGGWGCVVDDKTICTQSDQYNCVNSGYSECRKAGANSCTRLEACPQ